MQFQVVSTSSIWAKSAGQGIMTHLDAYLPTGVQVPPRTPAYAHRHDRSPAKSEPSPSGCLGLSSARRREAELKAQQGNLTSG